MTATKSGAPWRGLQHCRGRRGNAPKQLPVALALAVSLKEKLIEILERRRDCLDRDPREDEFLRDLRRSLTASRLLNENRIPLKTWKRIEKEVRDRWVQRPIHAPLRVCLGCCFPCADCQRERCNCSG